MSKSRFGKGREIAFLISGLFRAPYFSIKRRLEKSWSNYLILTLDKLALSLAIEVISYNFVSHHRHNMFSDYFTGGSKITVGPSRL